MTLLKEIKDKNGRIWKPSDVVKRKDGGIFISFSEYSLILIHSPEDIEEGEILGNIDENKGDWEFFHNQFKC